MVTPIATVQLMKVVLQPGFDTGMYRDAGTIPPTHHTLPLRRSDRPDRYREEYTQGGPVFATT